ncbi:MAG: D-aminoacyl-tRNA deacylase [Simkaniaceae bacterium]
MRLLLQRVKQASVCVDNKVIGEIQKGLLIFLGIHHLDEESSLEYLTRKAVNLRIFPDENGKMNLSVKDIGGEILLVSQFTLYGNCQKGMRPSFIEAAPPKIAEPLYKKFIAKLELLLGKNRIRTGQFGAAMQVQLVNDGPVTILCENGGPLPRL